IFLSFIVIEDMPRPEGWLFCADKDGVPNITVIIAIPRTNFIIPPKYINLASSVFVWYTPQRESR
ncbi:MAG TPA: hypothetical protein DIT99_08735, partial [Candidatus Latescibacteria bacterium]|nr:hypothetical protein [Candidatus Latescibacterota bacterium]